jgi:hypothetical protein
LLVIVLLKGVQARTTQAVHNRKAMDLVFNPYEELPKLPKAIGRGAYAG